MRVVAIDPGYKKGALAVVTDDDEEADVWDLPLIPVLYGNRATTKVDYERLREMISDINPDLGVLEIVGGREDDSPVTAFRFGAAWMSCQIALRDTCPRYTEVSPGVWKRAAMIFKHAKDAARDEAIAHYPHLEKKLIRKMDVDRADALLIGRTTLMKELYG